MCRYIEKKCWVFHNINPKKTKAWKKLEDSKNLLIKKTLKDLFNKEDNRLDYLSVELENIYVDFLFFNSRTCTFHSYQLDFVIFEWRAGVDVVCLCYGRQTTEC